MDIASITVETTFEDALSASTQTKREPGSIKTLACNLRKSCAMCGLASIHQIVHTPCDELVAALSKVRHKSTIVELLEIIGRGDATEHKDKFVQERQKPGRKPKGTVVLEVDDNDDSMDGGEIATSDVGSDDVICIGDINHSNYNDGPPEEDCFPDFHYVLVQYQVGEHAVRFEVIQCVDNTLLEPWKASLHTFKDMGADEFSRSIQHFEKKEHKELRDMLTVEYGKNGGKVYTLGIYSSRLEAEFARQRCIDKEYVRTNLDMPHVYGRHTPQDDGQVDVFALPTHIHVWDPHGDVVVDVRSPKLDHMRMAVEACLHATKDKTQRKDSTIRHRAAVTVAKLRELFRGVLEEDNKKVSLSQQQLDQKYALSCLWETMDTLINQTHSNSINKVHVDMSPDTDITPHKELLAALSHKEKRIRDMTAESGGLTEKLKETKAKLQQTLELFEKQKEERSNKLEAMNATLLGILARQHCA